MNTKRKEEDRMQKAKSEKRESGNQKSEVQRLKSIVSGTNMEIGFPILPQSVSREIAVRFRETRGETRCPTGFWRRNVPRDFCEVVFGIWTNLD
jgi:hypothetical protein